MTGFKLGVPSIKATINIIKLKNHIGGVLLFLCGNSALKQAIGKIINMFNQLRYLLVNAFSYPL